MADRTVSVRLKLNVSAFSAGGKDAQKTLSELDRKFTQSAGFAAGFRRKLEDATKQLPDIEIDADTSPADREVAKLRARLKALSAQEIGVDIDAGPAFAEMAEIQAELEAIEKGASFELRADTGKAIAELQAVLREIKRIDGQTVDVGIQVEGGAFAQKLRAQVQEAAASLPKIPIDADSSPAQRQVAELRSRLETLSGRTVGIDIDAAGAMAEIRAVENQLRSLGRGATVDVRADAGDALAKLAAVNAAANHVDGRTANVRVNADVGGALLAISLVGAALASLPAVATIGVGLGALGVGLSAAGLGALGFAAAAVPSLGRVNEALKETTSSAGGAGGAMKSAAQSAAEAASAALRLAQAQDRVKDSAAAVKKSQQGVQDALRNVKDAQDAYRASQERAAVASERVNEAGAAGARRVADAERSLADAHRSTQVAVEDLTRARERAIARIEDLELATRRGSLNEEGAKIAIERAKQRLDKITGDKKSTDLDKQEADLAYREALQRLDEVQNRNKDLAKEKAESDRKGVEGSDEVTAAKERIIDAQRREAEAAAAIGEAQVQAARDVTAAQRDAAKASQDTARAYRDIGDAQRKVGDAQAAVIKAQRDELRSRQQLKIEILQQKAALEKAGAAAGGGGGAASKMAELSKAEKALAKDIKAFTDAYEDWQKSLQPDIFPAIRSGMDLMTGGMKVGTPLIKSSAGAFDDLLKATNKGLQGTQWTKFFDDLTVAAPRAIEGLGNATGNVAGGLAGIIQAFLPYTDELMKWLESFTQKFEDWGQSLEKSEGFKSFMDYARENGPKAGEVLSNIGLAIGKIFDAAAEPASAVLDFLVVLSDKLANLDPEQVQAIAGGVAGIFAAAKLAATLKIGAFVVLADALSQMSPGQIEAVALAIAGVVVAVKGYQTASAAISWWQGLSGGIEKAGSAAERNKGKLASLGEAAGAVGGVLAVTTALGLLDSNLNGLDTKLGGMSKEMSDFARTGQLSGKLAEQWGDSLDTVVKDVETWDEALGRAGQANESFREAISRLAKPGPLEGFKTSYYGLLNAVTLGTTEFDKSAEQIGYMDQELANLVNSGQAGEAEQAFARLTKEAQEMGVPVEKLRDVFPQYSQAARVAGNASADAAVGIDKAKQKVDGLQKSLDIFSGRTDALQAIRNMETAYKDAAKAIEDSNGKLNVNAKMTDKQRDAVILAREKYGAYIQSVADGATAQEKLSGRTGDATLAVAGQLDKLFELAGSSKEAKDQVYELAAKFGISREQADKATRGAKDFRDMLGELKSKQIQIELDTQKAREQFQALLKSFSLASPEIPVGIRAPGAPAKKAPSLTPRANGGISDVAGREYMASGGIRPLGSSPSAMIASSPYMISGRGGPDVVFGEAGMEAYIPLSTGKRDRGLQVLQEAAGIMGMAVVPSKLQAASTTSTGGGSIPGSGAASVTVTGVDALRASLDTTAVGLTSSLGGATSTLDATLGDAGSLTSSLTGVGEVAGHLAGEVTGWGEVIAVQVPPLTDAVTQLGDALAAAASGDSKANTGSKGDERSPRGSSSSAKGGMALSAVRGTLPIKPESKIAIRGVASGTAGVAMSGSTNWSRVSKPVQSSSWSAPAPSTAPDASAGASGASGGASGGGPLVAVNGMTVRSEADIGQFAAQVAMRISGRG